MKKIAFLFPGQGSQQVGMGQDFHQEFDFVREIFDMAEEITRISLSKLCFKGPMGDLTMTVNLQPAVTAVNLAILTAIRKQGIRPDISAGHSLGEYSALCAGDVLSPPDTFKAVFKRGELMHRESLKYPGAMHAIVGLPIDVVDRLAAEVQNREGVVAVANHNMETQIVITGSPRAVEEVSKLASSEGGKSIPLKVSGAWHSALMKGAESEFEAFLKDIPFGKPQCGIIHNVTAELETEPDAIRSIMTKQLCSPVRWYDSMIKMMNENTTIFAEIGPGKVLTGLLKKTIPKDADIKIYNVNDLKSMERFLSDISA